MGRLQTDTDTRTMEGWGVKKHKPPLSVVWGATLSFLFHREIGATPGPVGVVRMRKTGDQLLGWRRPRREGPHSTNPTGSSLISSQQRWLLLHPGCPGAAAGPFLQYTEWGCFVLPFCSVVEKLKGYNYMFCISDI